MLGIARVGELKDVGRIGLKALVYFEIVSTLALLIGLVVVNVLKPGAGLNFNPATADVRSVSAYTTASKSLSTTEFILHVIPDTLVGAFSGGEILQVLLVAILAGLALLRLGESVHSLVNGIEYVSHVLFDIVAIVMRLAPIGAFGAIAFTVGRYGVGSLVSLGKLMAGVYTTCFLFVFIVLGLIARHRLQPLALPALHRRRDSHRDRHVIVRDRYRAS